MLLSFDKPNNIKNLGFFSSKSHLIKQPYKWLYIILKTTIFLKKEKKIKYTN